MKKLHWLLIALPAGLGLWILYRLIFGRTTVDEKTGAMDFKSIATRELRANNLLGVSVSGTFDWDNVDLSRSVPNKVTGKSIPGVDDKLGDKLVIFKTFQDGMNAGAWLLHDLYFGEGYNVLGVIGDRWAGKTPTPPNQFSDYSLGLGKIMKMKPDSVLNYGTDGINLMKGLARDENGTLAVALVPTEMYQAGLVYGQS